MSDNDPFAEFGGREIKDEEDPFAEFGGVKTQEEPPPEQSITSRPGVEYYKGPSVLEQLPEKGIAAIQAASLGFGDDIATTAGSVWDKLNGDERPFSQLVLDNSNKYRQATDEATENQPGSAFIGAMLSPTPIKGGKFITKAAQAAGYGALRGIGNSEGEYGKDALIGAGTGVAGQAVASGLGAVAGASSKYGKKVAEYTEKLREKMMKKAQDAFESARGSLGGRAQAVIQNIDVIRKAAERPDLPEDIRRAMNLLVQSQEMREAEINALANKAKIQDLGLSALQKAKGEFGEAVENMSPAAIDSATATAGKNWVSNTVNPRLKKFLIDRGAQAALPAIGYGIGDSIDPSSAWGKVIGGGIGLGAGLAIGRPGTSVGNMVNDPAFQRGMSSLAEKATYIPSKIAGPIAATASEKLGLGGLQAGITEEGFRSLKEYLESSNR